MEMTPVASSNLSAVGWDENVGLVVEFRNGGSYTYPDAPQSVYEGLLNAPSAGRYFAQYVRGTYSFERG